MSCCELSACHTAAHIMIVMTRLAYITEGAAVMIMMECVAVVPVPVVRPTVVCVPPARIVAPIPGRVPCIPCVAPEPVVYNGSVHVHRFNHVVFPIHIFISDYLHGHFVFLVFLDVYGSHVLIDIFGQNSLQHYQSFVPLSCFHYAQVIHLAVPIEVQITERAVGVVEHRLELLQVLSLCKQLSYDLQIESFRDVRTVGGYRNGFFRP